MKTIITKVKIAHLILQNDSGLKIELSTFGASIYSIELKNRVGIYEAMTLTPSNLEDFYTNTSYHGKTIGRYSGRIDKGVCCIDGQKYNLDINWNSVNSLHGGYEGISSRIFEYEIIEEKDFTDVIFKLVEEKKILPGVINYNIKYRIYNLKNQFDIYLDAISTEKTLLNLTNHTYFNLSGNCKNTILNHRLYLPCRKYTRLNNELITISIDEVNQIMDFTDNHEIGKFIEDPSLQNHTAKGYDHCFIKDNIDNDLIAVLSNPENGISLEISTSYPSVVFYSGNYPDDFSFNKEKIQNIKYHAVCLEPQFIPNGINMENQLTAVIQKNEKYSHYIKYKFAIC